MSASAPVSPLILPASLHDLTACYCYFPEQSAHQNSFISQYQDYLPDTLSTALPNRQAEFIAGRLSAASALQSAGLKAQVLQQNLDRSPQWPPETVGSISHKGNLAAAITAKRKDYQFVGLDIERAIPHQTALKLAPKILSNAERAVIEGTRIDNKNLEFSQGFTRVFSAKEALYKAIYPYVKRYLPFSICELTALSSDRLTLQLSAEIAKSISHTAPFEVHYTTLDEYQISVIADVVKI